MIIDGDEAKKRAIDFMKTWKGVKNFEVESVKKINKKEVFWQVNGKFVWIFKRNGFFEVSISKEGKTLGFSGAFEKVKSREEIQG